MLGEAVTNGDSQRPNVETRVSDDDDEVMKEIESITSGKINDFRLLSVKLQYCNNGPRQLVTRCGVLLRVGNI